MQNTILLTKGFILSHFPITFTKTLLIFSTLENGTKKYVAALDQCGRENERLMGGEEVS